MNSLDDVKAKMKGHVRRKGKAIELDIRVLYDPETGFLKVNGGAMNRWRATDEPIAAWPSAMRFANQLIERFSEDPSEMLDTPSAMRS